MAGRFLHPVSVPVHLADGGKTVKGVTTVVKITVMYMKSDSLVRFVAECGAVLLALRKITQLSGVPPARSRRCAPAGGGSR